MPYGTITKNLASIFGFLDSVVYSLVSLVLTGLYNIAGTKIFTESSLTEFTDKIYVMLGIFMLFKLAFSLLSGIVNPDKANDKQSGMQNIIKRVVITLALLLMVPSIFQFAYQVQGNVLKALPQIILGPNQSQDTETVGNNIALTVMKAFVNPNECGKELKDDDNQFDDIWEYSDVVSRKCDETSNGEKIFKYRYTFIVSTVVGIIMIVFLVLTSVDVAMRLIKLSILQIIAPIPIMTYIDPKSEKDGAFGNWMKECIQTYISLFIQMAVIYIIIFLVSSIAADLYSEIGTGGAGKDTFIQLPENVGLIGGLWVFIFIVIGAFFFMRQAPKYIMKVLGIKDGTGLGIGLSSGLAGIGALASGGGLRSAVAATATALDEGATANAEGKSAFSTGGLQKGRQIAANFKGEEKPVPLMQRLTNKMKEMEAAKYGVTDETIDKAKNARNAANSTYEQAVSKLNEAMQKGKDVEWNGQSYGVEEFRKMVYSGGDSFQAKAKKASSTYDDMVSFGKKMNVGKAVETYTDKYKSKPSDYTFTDATGNVRWTGIQEDIDSRIPNSISHNEHQVRQAQYSSLFSSPEAQSYVDRNEQRADARNNNGTSNNKRSFLVGDEFQDPNNRGD